MRDFITLWRTDTVHFRSLSGTEIDRIKAEYEPSFDYEKRAPPRRGPLTTGLKCKQKIKSFEFVEDSDAE